MGCAACEVPEHSLRLRTDDRRTDPRLRLRMAAPLTSSPVAAPLAQAHPGVGTFVAETRCQKMRDSSFARPDAQPRADLESRCARVPYTAGREYSVATLARNPTHQSKWARFLPAYGDATSSRPRPRARRNWNASCLLSAPDRSTFYVPHIPRRRGLTAPWAGGLYRDSGATFRSRVCNWDWPMLAPSVTSNLLTPDASSDHPCPKSPDPTCADSVRRTGRGNRIGIPGPLMLQHRELGTA